MKNYFFGSLTKLCNKNALKISGKLLQNLRTSPNYFSENFTKNIFLGRIRNFATKMH